MAKMVVHVSGFYGELAALIKRAGSFRKPLWQWAQHMVGSVKRNFKEQGRPNAWRPLKVNTLIARFLRGKKKGTKAGGQFAPNPLVYKSGNRGVAAVSTVAGFARNGSGRISRRGGLNKFAPAGMTLKAAALRAITNGKILIDRGASGGLLGSITASYPTDAQVEIGTNLNYAGPHQYGSPKQGISARPYLVIQDDDAEELQSLAALHMLGELK